MGQRVKESATILHLQRLSTEDGPGIRTTVFFKGCPLHCSWCHNPESISPGYQVQWLGNRCIGCRTCLPVCHKGALYENGSGLRIAREVCDSCGKCAEACPANAMERLGRQYELDALVSELLKDRAYFDSSGGGVTASGGEPTLQASFLSALFERLKSAGVHTALDTCGLCSRAALEIILPHTDLVLFDLKEMDPARHRQYTGSDNTRILENLRWVSQYCDLHGLELWVRTPLIPCATAREENIAAAGAFLADLPGKVSRWELCAFNNLCRDKYWRLNMEWEYAETALLTQAELDMYAAAARTSGVAPDIVYATGAVRAVQSRWSEYFDVSKNQQIL
jgi:pyruvate formate lyase activating enzyme